MGDARFRGKPPGRVDVDHRSPDVAVSGTGHDIRSGDALDIVPMHKLHGGIVSSEIARAYDSFDSLRVQPHCCREPEPYEHCRRDQGDDPTHEHEDCSGVRVATVRQLGFVGDVDGQRRYGQASEADHDEQDHENG